MFLWRIFLFQRTEKFCKWSFLFQKFSGLDKSLCVTDRWEGVSRFSVAKIGYRNIFCIRIVWEKIYG